MTVLLLALVLSCTYSKHAVATVCPSDATAIEQMISSADSCYMASKIANDCAWGSSIDVSFVAAASEICLKNYDQWSTKHKLMLEVLSEDCNEKYEGQSGTLYLSMNAFCILGATEVLAGLNEEVL